MKAISKKPPMGWNSWDCYGASVTEAEVKANADYMAKHLKEYGWEYIVVDINWARSDASDETYSPDANFSMDSFGRLIPAENRFPSAADGAGFKPLADYVHNLGLKFGIHIMRGIPKNAVRKNLPVLGTNRTAAEIADLGSACEWNPDMVGVDMAKDGAQEYYNSIVDMYAGWGVDFIKADDVARPYHKAEAEALSRAIAKTGRGIILSLSPGIAPLEDAEHFCEYANMWRMTDDFWDDWTLLRKMFDFCRDWTPYVGSGSWPDCDMLPLGRIGIRSVGGGRMTRFTKDEQRLMLSLWAIFRSPLMFGGDMTYNDDFTLSLMQNTDLIEINQNSHAGREVYRKGAEIVRAANGDDGVYYAALFNVGDTAHTATFPLSFLGLEKPCHTTEIWTRTQADNVSEISAEIPPHGVRLYRIVCR